MRRISAILLLVAFSLPLIAGTLQGDDSSLPACCRRAGIHHCDGMGHADSDSTNGPALKSGACPYFPTTANVAAFVKFALPATVGTLAPLSNGLFAARVRSRVLIHTSLGDSHPKRGPPSLLS